MLGIRSLHPLPADLLARPASAQVYVSVSVSGQSIRVSPLVYNTAVDVQRFVEVLAQVL